MESIPSSTLGIVEAQSNSEIIPQFEVVSKSEDVPHSEVSYKRVFDSDKVDSEENISKKCNAPSLAKKKVKKDVDASSKSPIEEVPPKRVKNTEPITTRPSLPKDSCSNTVSTHEELLALELPGPTDVATIVPCTSSTPGTSDAQPKYVEKQILSEFEDFNTESPQHLLRKSKRIVDTSSSLPPKKRRVVHGKKLILIEIANPKKSVQHEQIPKEVAIHASVSSPPEQSSLPIKHTDNKDFNEVEKILKKYVDQKFNALDQKLNALKALIKSNHTEMMRAIGKEVHNSNENMNGAPVLNIVGDFDKKECNDFFNNVDIAPKYSVPFSFMKVTKDVPHTDDAYEVNGTYKDATEQPISSSGVEVIRDVLITAEVVEPQQETDFSEPTQIDALVIPSTVSIVLENVIAKSSLKDSALCSNMVGVSDELTKICENARVDEGVSGVSEFKVGKKVTDKIKQDTSDSVISTSIFEGTNEVVETLLSQLRDPITVKLVKTVTQEELAEDSLLLQDSQLSTILPCKEIVLHSESKTPRLRSRMPFGSLTDFGSSDKGKKKLSHNLRQKYPFDGFGICYDPPYDLITEFTTWIEQGLLRTHAKKGKHYQPNYSSLAVEKMNFVVACPEDKNWFYLMSQKNRCWNDEHIDVIFYYLRKKSKHQFNSTYRYTTTNCIFKNYINATDARSIMNTIKGISIPAGSPWHLVDEVYIPVNCDKDFHWVLAVVVLKERIIRVYDSTAGSRKKNPSSEIQKLALLLPTYLQDCGFFEKIERTDWSSLDAYRDASTGDILGPQYPFVIEFAQGIAQQRSDSLDSGVFVAAFAEYISDGIPVSCNSFKVDYLRKRYATLLWKYGLDKAKEGYASDNDDPPKPRGNFLQIDYHNLIDLG